MKVLLKLLFIGFVVVLYMPGHVWAWSGQGTISTQLIFEGPPAGETRISTDGGSTWSLLSPGDSRTYDYATVREIVFNPTPSPGGIDWQTQITEIYVNGALVASRLYGLDFRWTMSTEKYGPGEHSVNVRWNYLSWSGQSTWSSETYTIKLGDDAPPDDTPPSPSPSPSPSPTIEKIPPVVKLATPFVSTRISKRPTFKVRWSATHASGIDSYLVRFRPANTTKWSTWKTNTTSTYGYFKGTAGRTYYFRVRAKDKSGNYGWSKIMKTIVPYNEGANIRKKIGFNGYYKSGKSPNYLTSLRYSYTRGNTLVYKLPNTNGIGLVTTKNKNRGRAKIYVDGHHMATVNAYSSKLRPRQLIYYFSFSEKRTHYLKIVNEGTPGRARFDVDGIVAGR